MANIEVSRTCNLGCPFCFAKNHLNDLEEKHEEAYISLSDYEERLNFLDRSNINQVRMIGGEPTLHPGFPELIRLAILRNKQVMIFTHGLMPKGALESLQSLSAEDCIVLINTNASKFNGMVSKGEKSRRLYTIGKLGPKVLLGYTISSKNFNLEDLLSIITEYNCRKSIRVGLAHPLPSNTNQFLHPKAYTSIAHRLVNFAGKAKEKGIQLEFDCGFVRCMFSNDQIDYLKSLNTDMGWNCSPVLDVQISGNIIMCFPNAGVFDTQLTLTTNAAQIWDEMTNGTEYNRIVGIYPECSSCLFAIRHECSGGGLEHILRRFRHSPFQIKVPMLNDCSENLEQVVSNLGGQNDNIR